MHLKAIGMSLPFVLSACAGLDQVGRAPNFSDLTQNSQFSAMYSTPFPEHGPATMPGHQSSLWSSARASLLGDRRAAKRGDILTVVIEINDRAEFSNATGRQRNGSSAMAIPQFLGLPQSIDRRLSEGASMDNAIRTQSASTFSGDGSVARNEKLALRVAATVVEELPNGVIRIEGQQEVRVNFELRELTVTGYVRPGDISRQNEVTYDKIAGARISYGGRGQITDVQQPRWGQQITDKILPF